MVPGPSGLPDALLGQLGHGELGLPAVVSHVAILGAELWLFQVVMAHFGVLVVDGVDEYEDDGDHDDRERHQSRDEGKIVL